VRGRRARGSQLAGEEIGIAAALACLMTAVMNEHIRQAVDFAKGAQADPELAIFALHVVVVAGAQHRRSSKEHSGMNQAALPTGEPAHLGIVQRATPGSPGGPPLRVDEESL
jgi:hypothetical protein